MKMKLKTKQKIANYSTIDGVVKIYDDVDVEN